MKKLTGILLWVWQTPQHLLAGIVYLYFSLVRGIDKQDYLSRGRDTLIPPVKIIWVNAPIGVSLGRYIFLEAGSPVVDVCHETGHSVQSLIFGPLYLLLTGLPSLLFNNIWDRVFHGDWSLGKRCAWYYNRYPERWADKLGGVKREAVE